MDLVVVVLSVALVAALAAVGWTLVSLSRQRDESQRLLVAQIHRVEDAWQRMYALQQAEISELRNRLASHSWEEFHNLQAATPHSLDRASDVLARWEQHNEANTTGAPVEDIDTAGQLEERLRQNLRDAGIDLEQDETDWQTVVG